ncbi:hypothetical protein JCM11641_000971 [Rhodosporidiobolus odoratus]
MSYHVYQSEGDLIPSDHRGNVAGVQHQPEVRTAPVNPPVLESDLRKDVEELVKEAVLLLPIVKKPWINIPDYALTGPDTGRSGTFTCRQSFERTAASTWNYSSIS